MALEFNEEKHEYKWDGRLVPGVSNIIAPLRDFSGIPQLTLEIKREWGKAVHLYTAMYDDGTLDKDRSKWDERMIPVVDSWCRFKEQFMLDDKNIAIEQKLYSSVFRYAGTPDRIYKSQNIIVDIKTAANPQPASGVQLAAYSRLAEENGLVYDDGRCRLIEVCLADDGTFKTKQYEFKENWNIFMCCYSIYGFTHGGK